MQSTLSERDGGGTKVDVVTDMTITGRLASFSRGGMIEDVSNRLLGEFASCLQASLAPAEPAAAAGEATVAAPPAQAAPPQAGKPISGIRLFLGILRDRLRRLFGRGR
jgi:hypothetical protein